ncbi:J domain-containing protein [Formosa sp. S-31]|uniref:J domain-containing protein n=1 Tax=Formosa sp. S-31 TaxID=2790949 RepID=UPI003EBA119E
MGSLFNLHLSLRPVFIGFPFTGDLFLSGAYMYFCTMNENQFPAHLPEDELQVNLRISIEAVKQDIDSISNSIQAFEDVLRQHLSEYIIEAQELTVLYKAQKRAKKDKRLAQKRRGKNYKAPTGLQTTKDETPEATPEDQSNIQLKKQLYREAMLQVHPDKFSLSPNEQDSATELTAQLIHIYKNDTLEALKTFHAQLFSETLGLPLAATETAASLSKTEALQLTLQQLRKELEALKKAQLYHILSNYENPLHFADELIVYYKDKIEKLKKRTRTKNMR